MLSTAKVCRWASTGPLGVAALSGGHVAICDCDPVGANRVVVLRADSGTHVRDIYEGGGGRFDGPSGVCGASGGLMAVCEFGRHCVTVMRESGAIVRTIGGKGVVRYGTF